jgi:hypothetical protein
VLRNTSTGQFEVYDISNTITAASSLRTVGLDWQLGGFAADPPSASNGSMDRANQPSQFVQAMAGFGGGNGPAENSAILPLAGGNQACRGKSKNNSSPLCPSVISPSVGWTCWESTQWNFPLPSE